MKTVLMLLLTIALCSCYTYKPYVAPAPDEPYSIKLNDTLGIKLGMSLADYKKLHPRDRCEPPDADGMVHCDIGLPKATTIGPIHVTDCSVQFYRDNHFEIYYRMVSDAAFGYLVESLKGKFGPGREIIKNSLWSWDNSDSHMMFDWSTTDRTGAMFWIYLTKESNELDNAKRNRKQVETKHDL